MVGTPRCGVLFFGHRSAMPCQIRLSLLKVNKGYLRLIKTPSPPGGALQRRLAAGNIRVNSRNGTRPFAYKVPDTGPQALRPIPFGGPSRVAASPNESKLVLTSPTFSRKKKIVYFLKRRGGGTRPVFVSPFQMAAQQHRPTISRSSGSTRLRHAPTRPASGLAGKKIPRWRFGRCLATFGGHG